MLAIALTGKTKAAPSRSSTTLSRMLSISKINAAALDARLAPLYEYSKSEGGRYLGRAVGDELVKLHLADEESVGDLRFDKLWDVLKVVREAFCELLMALSIPRPSLPRRPPGASGAANFCELPDPAALHAS